MVDMIIKTKGGHRSDFNDWSLEEIKQRLNALETEQWVEHDNENLFVPPFGQPIGIFPDEAKNSHELNTFNPLSYTGMLKIDHRSYPTIQHYIIAHLISNSGRRRHVDGYGVATFGKGMGINAARKTIMVDPHSLGTKPGEFLSLKLASEKYDTIENETVEVLLSIYTVTALNKKFEDVSMQDILVLTGDDEIRWNSPQNFFLGYGNKEHPGKNYVGTTMMNIRETINESRIGREEVDVELDHILHFINKDTFIMDWVKMKVEDMCGIVNKLQNYLLDKDGIVLDLTEFDTLKKLVQYVLDDVYQPSRPLIELAKNVDMEIPRFFVNMVKNCKGMSTGTQPLKVMDNNGVFSYNKEIESKKEENDIAISILESEFWGDTRIDHTKDESDEFALHAREEWAEFWREINKSDVLKHVKQAEMVKLKLKQKNEYNEFWGIDRTNKTSDDISRHEHEVSVLKKEFSRYLRQMEGVEKHHYLITKEVAQLYWNRIVVMLSDIIQTAVPATASNIRDVLVKTERTASGKANCVRIIANEQDNCIVSAILNLLVGIKKFKREFSGITDIDTDDVGLATSIIINTKVQIKIKNPDEPEIAWKKDGDENIGSVYPDVYDNVFSDISSSGSFPQDRSENEVDVDVDEENFDPYNQEDPVFAFKRGAKGGKSNKMNSSGDLAKVEQQVIQLGIENSKQIATSILKNVQVIKNARMKSDIKQNRINFFATIR